MQELIKKIEQWAEDRNIINGSKPIDQAMKLFSEFGELADNVGKGRDCRDDIGDVFVVLTIMCKQLNMSMINVNPNKSKFKKTPKHMVSLLLIDFHEIITCPSMCDFDDAVGTLENIAECFNYTLQECIQIAYDDIKNRKGVMFNGTFIKDTDPAYNEVLQKLGKA